MPKKKSHAQTSLISEVIEKKIYLIRGQKVILDRDLARIYDVPTFRFNEAVKRNLGRFPDDFMFRLTEEEWKGLISQIAISKKGRGGRRTLPFVFTEHGAIMAANILGSAHAIEMSVFVIRAFVKMRSLLTDHRELALKLKALEEKLTKRLDVHEASIVDILRRLIKLLEPPQEESVPAKPPIGFRLIKGQGLNKRLTRV